MTSHHEHGFALTFAVIIALLTAVSVYAVLTMVLAQARQGNALIEQQQAQYAAEGGLVWAQQQLFVNPLWSSAAGNTDVTIAGTPVDIVIPPCGANPCPPRTLQAKTQYQ